MRGGAAPDHYVILPGSKWSCLLLRIVLQDATGEVAKIYPALKLRVFVDDITFFLSGRNKRTGGVGKEGVEGFEE